MSSNSRRYCTRSSTRSRNNTPASGQIVNDRSSNFIQSQTLGKIINRTGASWSQTNLSQQYSYHPSVAQKNHSTGPMYSQQQYPFIGGATMYSGYLPPENPAYMPISSISNIPIHTNYVNNYQLLQPQQRQQPALSSNFNQNGASILNHSSNTLSNDIIFDKINLYDEVKVLIKTGSIKANKAFEMDEIVPYLTTHDDRYCVVLRFCKYSSDIREQVDRLPKEFTLLINQIALQIRNKYTYTHYDITSYVMTERKNRKQNLLFKIMVDPNSIANQGTDIADFYYGVFLMKKLDHKTAFSNFIAKSPLDLNVSLDIVRKTLDTEEIAIVEDSKQIKISLLCPLSATKIKHPARSIKCEHVHCFDAETFFSINAITPRWKCPICMNIIKLDDLIIDRLFLNILTDAPAEVTEAIIFEDGKFEYIQDTEQNINSSANLSVENTSLKPTSSQSLSSKRSIEEESPKSAVKVAKVQNEIEWITIDSDDDDNDDVGINKSDKTFSSPSSQSKTDDDSDSDIEIVYEKIVPRNKANSRLTFSKNDNNNNNCDTKPHTTASKSSINPNETILNSKISHLSTSSASSLSSTAHSLPSHTFSFVSTQI